METADLNKLLECALEAVRTAGRYALDNYSRRREILCEQDDDIKLLLDLECQERIFAIIKKAFPDHHLLGEEGSSAGGDSGFRWIVDPIDGTINFSHGLPIWCSSVAVQFDGRTVAGAVYAPMLERCYHAHAESPAFCNDSRIQVSDTAALGDAMVMSGFPKRMKHDDESRGLFERMLGSAQRTRIYGAAALDLCFVADGGADAYVERGIYLWDIAAAALLIERAGGRTRILEEIGGGKLCFMAANPLIFDQLLEC
jgi:myo-inositol-1(or 4)-monophosphatase